MLVGKGTDQSQSVCLGKAHVSFGKLHGVVTVAVLARMGTMSQALLGTVSHPMREGVLFLIAGKQDSRK